MLKIFGLVLLAPFALVAGLLVGSSWVLVEVDAKDGPHLYVPAPVGVAAFAAPFIPREERVVELKLPEEVRENLGPALLEVIDEIRAQDDFEMVRVESSRESVVVAKEGDWITVHVQSEREEVRVRAPLSVARNVIEAIDFEGDTLEVDRVIRAVTDLPGGQLVEVSEPDAHVRVWAL